MAGAGLTYRDIATALSYLRLGSITCGGLATRMATSATVVQRGLDAMLKAGAVQELLSSTGQRRYTLTGQPVPDGEVPLLAAGRTRIRETVFERASPVERDGDDEAENKFAASEIRKAEQLWKARMGDQRWRDDPRAVNEPVGRAFLFGSAAW